MIKIDENVLSYFMNVTTVRELSTVLDVEFKNLIYNVYKLKIEDKYTVFDIKKRNGNPRTIIAPIHGIKLIQENLSKILLEIHNDKNCVHGFLKNKSIKTNAKPHVKKRVVVNIDLENFFPSINFGRVRGIFMSFPFNFSETISTVLAQICCYDGYLPQGAPSSPIISNYICRRLDNQLLKLAKKGKFSYTRYADDITFSTNLKKFPLEIGEIVDDKLILSTELIELIKSNGFSINNEKVRYAFKNNRQEVTGLIVNSFLNVNRNYVRHVRAMIHAWEKFGIEAASREHFLKYNYKSKVVNQKELAYQAELVGKIGFIGQIRGKEDDIYKKLYERVRHLKPQVRSSIVESAINSAEFPIVFGEGKTDWKHLNAALNYFKQTGRFVDLNISFQRYEASLEINNSELMKICEGNSKTQFHKVKLICLFDRDDSKYNNKATINGTGFKHWGNKVYSALLPIPNHRSFPEICIEHYYSDDDIKTIDKSNRRLYLSTEFDKDTRVHLSDNNLFYKNKFHLKSSYPRIFECDVFNEHGKNVALSKNAFADNCMLGKDNFTNISFENFDVLFELFEKILLDDAN